MNIDDQKKEIRKAIRALKRDVSLEDKKKRSQKILDDLEKNESFKDANTVMLYWSMDDEVHTHDFVLKWASKKRIILPCVKGDLLELRVFKGLENLIEGDSFGILEPSGELFTNVNSIDLIVVPGVAFDKRGYRIGYGGGFYDIFMSKLKNHTSKVGIAFDLQVTEEISYESFDIKIDSLLTETNHFIF